MESLDFISKLLDGRLVLGNKEEIIDGLFIIPVYRVKISFLNLKTDLKASSDGASGSINVTPICLIKIYNGSCDIINLDENNKKEIITDAIPNILGSIDLSGILKNIKI